MQKRLSKKTSMVFSVVIWKGMPQWGGWAPVEVFVHPVQRTNHAVSQLPAVKSTPIDDTAAEVEELGRSLLATRPLTRLQIYCTKCLQDVHGEQKH